MANSQDIEDLMTRVDSIQSRFMQSLITGKRDPIFREDDGEMQSAFEGRHPQTESIESEGE